MYSSKENVNQLTSLLVKYGVQHAVVCPGSRNAPLSHNLAAHPAIRCYSVVDERSAGYYALGQSLACRRPVAVCVTSGTALLNLAPAVAEACYLHAPLIILSADRPPSWIDQQDGQTLPQPAALGRLVRKAVTLPEPSDDDQRWYSNRLINEALTEATRFDGAPVHINVPISEPLFDFNVTSLPDERQIRLWHSEPSAGAIDAFCRIIDDARRPMIIVGQTTDDLAVTEDTMCAIGRRAVVLCESLSALPRHPRFDEALQLLADSRDYQPDCIVYLGGDIVSKRLKFFLRHAPEAKSWTVNPRGEIYDTFCNLQGVLQCSTQQFIDHLGRLPKPCSEKPFVTRWNDMLQTLDRRTDAFVPPFSQMAAVRAFERTAGSTTPDALFHYGNSSSVRLANLYARHHVHCNRGVNGIEGSLSTAAGASVASGRRVYCVIGDLSFFYDQNALWNRHLKGNLRILLLNNGGGGIFRQLKGLEASPSRDLFIAGSHQTTAEGVCLTHHVTYLSAGNQAELDERLDQLVRAESDRPVLLEVHTDAAADARAMRGLIEWLGQTSADSHTESSTNNA